MFLYVDQFDCSVLIDYVRPVFNEAAIILATKLH